jgi:RNA polymerase sigma factor (sigma-70 family)
MRKLVTNDEFIEAYGHLYSAPEDLTPKQRDNRNIMHSVTSRYAPFISQNALNDCALQALWRCLGYHEEGWGQKFTTSLWRFTDWECKRELLKIKHLSKTHTIPISEFNDAFDMPSPETSQDVDDIRECINLLLPIEKQLIQEYYFERRTMEEIGRLHGYSKEAARQKIAKAVNHLKTIFMKTI